LFLERDQPSYASNRDAPILPYCQSRLYIDLEELRARFTPRISAAAAVIVGSHVSDGRRVCDWVLDHAAGVKAFYDIDTSVTLAKLRNDSCEYLRASQVPEFDVLLSFTGGPVLQRWEGEFGARCARALYCSVDVDQEQPMRLRRDIDLGYLGPYSDDRQPTLEALLNEPARRLPKRRFAVAGAQYPSHLVWPKNVQRIDHMAPGSHAQFYGRQRFTLNLTRADMRKVGYSPSVRLLEAAACGTPIISDEWVGLGEVFEPNSEILLARTTDEVTHHLDSISDEQARQIADAARERICAEHSSARRAEQLESYLSATRGGADRHSAIGVVAKRGGERAAAAQ
jgi:spore maturation protein CgeB